MNFIVAITLLLVEANVAFGGYVGTGSLDGVNYMYYDKGDDTTSWDAALSKCRWKVSIPMELAMPSTRDINNAVADLTNGNYLTWVGGTDSATEGAWIWFEDATKISWTNWASGQPNNHKGSQHCLQINYQAKGAWDDEQCVDGRGYVCQTTSFRLSSSDFSELFIYDQWRMPKTFWGAKRQCERIGARLVQIKDEQSKVAIQKKMENTGKIKYWVEMENTASRCSVLGRDDSEEHDCSDNMGFMCEIVWPHDTIISNEYATVAESGDLQIDCTASGFPQPEVGWYKDDELVPNQIIGKASSTLLIKNAQPKDNGRYLCVASTSYNGLEKTSMGFANIEVTPGEN